MAELYRPKTFVMYRYGFEFKCYIHCYPQQKWELTATDNKGVELYNKSKNITIELGYEDFNKHWKSVK